MKRFASVPARRAGWRARWQAWPLHWRGAALACAVALLLMGVGRLFLRERGAEQQGEDEDRHGTTHAGNSNGGCRML